MFIPDWFGNTNDLLHIGDLFGTCFIEKLHFYIFRNRYVVETWWWSSECARWRSFRWCKALISSNRKLSSPLALTGTHHYLNWVVFSTNLTKDAPIKLYHISSRLRAIILGCYYLLWLEWLRIDVVLIFICFYVYVLAWRGMTWHAQIHAMSSL